MFHCSNKNKSLRQWLSLAYCQRPGFDCSNPQVRALQVCTPTTNKRQGNMNVPKTSLSMSQMKEGIPHLYYQLLWGPGRGFILLEEVRYVGNRWTESQNCLVTQISSNTILSNFLFHKLHVKRVPSGQTRIATPFGKMTLDITMSYFWTVWTVIP